MKITENDILKLARMSMISVSEADIPSLVSRIDTVINYVSVLQKIVANQKEHSLPHNINVTRPDIVRSTNSEPLLDLAPQREENYFVVPMVLKAD